MGVLKGNETTEQIRRKLAIPTALANLTDDTTHRLVTDTEKSTWNGKAPINNPTFTGTETINKIVAGNYNFAGDNHQIGVSSYAGSSQATQFGFWDVDGVFHSTFEIDRAGVVKYNGTPISSGTDGASAYVYIAYASDSSGTGFTTTFNSSLNYIAIRSSNTALTPLVSDFTGLWFNYKGAAGTSGTNGTNGLTVSVNSVTQVGGNITITTANVADSTDKRYCTDAQKTVIGNTSGTNSGNETATTIKTALGITTLSGSNTGDQTLSGLGGVPTTRTVNSKALSADISITASDVGLGSVNNTADTAKPVSTAQQTALDLKAPLASPTFTGDPQAPTPTTSDNDTSIATTAFVKSAITAAILLMFPVGSRISNTSGTNPGTYLGGTWVAWGAGRFPIGIGNNGTTNYTTAEATGGEEKHTLDVTEIPAHSHPIAVKSATGGGTASVQGNASAADWLETARSDGNVGGGLAHNNLPPFEVEYMWKRTA